MTFGKKHITLKDGRNAILRAPQEEDAAEILALMKQTSAETDFLANYPEEWTMTEESERIWISRTLTSDNVVSIQCELDGNLVGNCSFTRMSTKKTHHRATLGICVLKQFWGLGIADKLMGLLIEIASETGVQQLELEFIEGNERARRLYERFGFIQTGTMPDSFRLRDGSSLAAVFMRKTLPPQSNHEGDPNDKKQ